MVYVVMVKLQLHVLLIVPLCVVIMHVQEVRIVCLVTKIAPHKRVVMACVVPQKLLLHVQLIGPLCVAMVSAHRAKIVHTTITGT